MSIETTYKASLTRAYILNQLQQGVAVNATNLIVDLKQLFKNKDYARPQFEANNYYVSDLEPSSAESFNKCLFLCLVFPMATFDMTAWLHLGREFRIQFHCYFCCFALEGIRSGLYQRCTSYGLTSGTNQRFVDNGFVESVFESFNLLETMPNFKQQKWKSCCENPGRKNNYGFE